MSAYVVDKATVVYLAKAGASVRLDPGHYGGVRWYHDGTSRVVNHSDYEAMASLAKMLLGECVASVKARYPRDTDDTLPGPVGAPWITEPVTVDDIMSLRWSTYDPVQVLKCISCYEYQSCEHDGWAASEAKAYCDALRGRAIGCLEGYEEAEWGHPETEPERVARYKRETAPLFVHS